MKASIACKKVKMKTYKVGEGNEAPHFIEKKQYQGACGKVYPLQVVDQILDETEEKEYEMVQMENEYISVDILPAIGGKIYGARMKKNGYEFIYENPVVKPALIGLCGPWVSGGVEFNWPQHHRPTTYKPLACRFRTNPDGSVSCTMGELEPLTHMRGMVEVTIRPGSSVVEARGLVTNCTDRALPFMWWNNTAVRVHGQYKAIFPPDVEFGSDHDRRAIIPFPVMKGVFKTARPYDYGAGTDVTWFSNVKVPTSLMIPRGETAMDFLGGYDYSKEAGTVMIHDHHVSPGAKMFTWGDGEFGKKWCANLTDNDDRYMELMTGSYTDNQPDFAYIEPGETREFITCWYPVTGIGNISNASVHGAVRLDKAHGANGIGTDETGANARITVGACVTRPRAKVRLTLTRGETVLYEKSGTLGPEEFWLETVDISGNIQIEELTLTLADAEEGTVLVSYTPPVKGKKEPPKARGRAPYPADVATVDLLYTYGRHLAQYKHGTYKAEDYFREALRREPEDARCNLEMGKAELEKGRFDEAESYLKTAMSRVAFENTSPEDTEVYYQMGRVKRFQGKLTEAYGFFRAAAWQRKWASAAYFESACISSAAGQKERAVSELTEAIRTNARFYGARVLLGYLTGDPQKVEAVLDEFPLDGTAQYALKLMNGRPVDAFVREEPESVLDAALFFEKAGFVKEARAILEDCAEPSLNLRFHLQALGGAKAEGDDLSRNLPNRLEDIACLSCGDWRAQYMLGCLYYDKENYEAAAAAWEKSKEAKADYGYTWRNLALAYYDHLGRRDRALPYMREAVKLAPQNPRLVYELMQIEKEENLPLADRIATTDRFSEQVVRRDDAWLDAAILRILRGDYKEAEKMLLSKTFHIYEGGEGKLTKYHRWLHVLMADEAIRAGKYEEAAKALKGARVYPASYGEGTGFLPQDANVHYTAGILCERTGQRKEALRCYSLAESEPELVNEILFFTGLCEEKLGHKERAERHYRMLLSEGEEYAANPDRYGYFGVGTESPLPFESDIRRNNMLKAHLYKMLACRGLREMAACEGEKRAIEALEPDYPLLVILKKLQIV